jgi:APA family basic amino acid/polyamine antiporter
MGRLRHDASAMPDSRALATDGGLRRVLGPVSATSIVVGAIVGVGIFFTPTQVAGIAGRADLALWIWVAGGVVALLGALTFAELGGMYSRAGGQYEILRDAYGPGVAFCFVFCNSTAIVTGGTAIIAMVCAENLLAAVAPGAGEGSRVAVLSVVLYAGVALANVAGIRWGAAIQNVTVFAKIAVLLAVVALALRVAPGPDSGPAAAGPAGDLGGGWLSLLFAGLVPTLFAYGGWQYALWMSGEVREPRRNVPLAIVLGVAIVILVYVAVNWAYLHLLGYSRVAASRALASDAISVVWPEIGGRFVAGAVALSAFGVLNTQIMSAPRLLYGMARDGRFFAVFGEAHPRFATPAHAIAFIAAIALGLLLAAGRSGVGRLLTGVVMVDAVFFALTGAAVLVLRRRRRDADRPVRVPGYPVVPGLFVLLEIAIIYGAFQIDANRSAAWIGLCWIAAAVVCYRLGFRRAASP